MKPAETLYDKLCALEHMKVKHSPTFTQIQESWGVRLPSFSDNLKSMQDTIAPYASLPHYSPITVQTPSDEFLTSAQKHLVQQYQFQPLMQLAITRHQTIEQTVTEVQKTREGWRNYFPRGLNAWVNDAIDELKPIVGDFSFYRTQGLWKRDNKFNRFGAYAMVSAVSTGVYFLLPSTPIGDLSLLQASALTGAVLSLFLGFLAESGRGPDKPYIFPNPQLSARFLDEKIREFYS